jgi:hypothetical protein
MRFHLAVPATPFVPPLLDVNPTVVGLVNNSLPLVDGARLAEARLRAYLLADHVRLVVVAPVGRRRWREIAAAATGAAPTPLGGYLGFRLPAALPLLRAEGDRVRRGSGRARVEAWLRFDGRRAHVEARAGSGAPTALSPPGADAGVIAAATDAAGRSAVLFTAERRGRIEVQVATRDRGGRWRRVILDRRSRPVWSPHVAVGPGGSIVATWFTAATPTPLLRAAIRLADGRWLPVATLDAAEGVADVASAPAGTNGWRIAWHDDIGTDQRVLTATYHGRWQPAQVVGSTFAAIGRVRIEGPHASRVVWSTKP